MLKLPRTKKLESGKNIIVIECCSKCDTHYWNTHHDEGAYHNYAVTLATRIRASHPDTTILFN